MKTEEKITLEFVGKVDNVFIELPTKTNFQYTVWIRGTGYGKDTMKECIDYIGEKFPETSIELKCLHINHNITVNVSNS